MTQFLTITLGISFFTLILYLICSKHVFKESFSIGDLLLITFTVLIPLVNIIFLIYLLHEIIQEYLDIKKFLNKKLW